MNINYEKQKNNSPQIPLKILFFIFFLSGFAGLIYESIWTHYLKLFLGHAAYAQTLVLSIFMLGMALGSWFAAKLTLKTQRFFIIYALVEFTLGLFALSFHSVSQGATSWFFDSIAPTLSSSGSITIAKWALASLLIVPQSILIGMTFPLLANGLLSVNRDEGGKMISTLYFSNSIGASIGVITSGFLLINWVGLQGTIQLSGAINIFIAFGILFLVKRYGDQVHATEITSNNTNPKSAISSRTLLLWGIVFFTGTASFIYEIVWIRLLSLVLGSATHSFELMLSAFILGLSLGGFFIRNKVDHLKNPFATLALIQIAMGVVAIFSLLLYNYSFEFMQITMLTLRKVITGYYLYNFSSNFISLIIMLPATIFAGMTLPIIMHLLVKDSGDKSVGQAYALNTLGAIFGVLLTVHILLPILGVKNAMLIGAGLDVTAGLVIFGITKSYTSQFSYIAMIIATVLCFSVMSQEELNQNKLVSGVFRSGSINYENKVLYYKDGKTSSVSVFKSGKNIVLSTNGKPDASIRPAPSISDDEATQVLLGAIPMLLAQKKDDIAIIGFGSGMSTHSVLASPQVKQVTTIEIEPAMVEGARLLHEKTFRAFDDPRSKIVFEDAKTYFAANKNKYDVIIAEPSNPWVSGVSSLFSTEFYASTKKYINDGGLFAQWVQTYELDPLLLASIANALAENFNYYDIYATDNGDILFISSDKPINTKFNLHQKGPVIKNLLASLEITKEHDLLMLKLGSKAQLSPLFNKISPLTNSNFYPIVDQQAVKSRFLSNRSSGILSLKYSAPPVKKHILDLPSHEQSNGLPYLKFSESHKEAQQFYKTLINHEVSELKHHRNQFFLLTQNDCNLHYQSTFWKYLPIIFKDLTAHLTSEQLKAVWPKIEEHACISNTKNNAASKDHETYLELFRSISNTNYSKVLQLSNQLILVADSKEKEDNKEVDDDISMPTKYLKHLWLWAAILDKNNTKPPFKMESIYTDIEDENWISHLLELNYKNMKNTHH